MLQKTSLRIKHFLNQRLNQSASDLTRDLDDSRFADLKVSIGTPKRLSWLSQSPSPTENFPLRRASSNATARSHHFNHFNTAHSSASSLCSCECGGNPAVIECSLSRVKSEPVQPEILYLPPELPKGASENAKTWRLIFPEPEHPPQSPRLNPTSKSRIKTPPLTIIPIESPDLFDALGTGFGDDEDKTPTQSINYFSNSTMLSDNVEQLIRETDEAFKAVGTALADAKAATQGWYDTKSNTSVTRTLSISRGILRGNREGGNPRPVSMSLIESPIARQRSGTKLNAKGKVKKPGKKKSIIFGRGFRTTHSPPAIPSLPETANATTRWTINEVATGMVDVFSGKRFRTEVDEMLTPTRIQKLKAQHLAEEDARRASEESLRTNTSTASIEMDDGVDRNEGGDTPTEPFFLERLSERTDAAGRPSSPPSPYQALPIPERAESRRGPVTAVERLTASSRKVGFTDPLATSASISRAGMIFDTFSFPAPPFPPPPRTLRRSSASSKGIPMLPTIPEISPLQLNLSPTQFQFFTHSKSLPMLKLVEPTPPSHILLPSTSFSLNAPWYRHGPIRIEKIIKPKLDTPWSPGEESLDWVAFQMAISGNMDEIGRDFRSDSMWEMDEVEVDEIEAWWEGYGMGLGAIDKENKGSDVALTSSRCSPVEEKGKRETREVVKLKPKPKPKSKVLGMGGGVGVGMNKVAEEQLVRTWRADVDTAKVVLAADGSGVDLPIPVSIPVPVPSLVEVRRPSLAESLPPSPMLDFGIVSPMKDGEIIPMGFNLGHDLGDFLRWESSYVGFIGDLR
ncbi:uncharacterized protein PAC_04986 [Phialocephala subalpina]|uniref:Uncharacterized protein n=1 Tax=Phialocephala subalpina TaxID=576137 RepID=A0A1L7WQP7_9HELO|nr:uncharacterized protein PAC_04986 [Phialocephala subalpina]